MDGNGNRHRQTMSTMLSKSKKNSNGIWGQTGGKTSDVGSNRIYRYIRLESI